MSVEFGQVDQPSVARYGSTVKVNLYEAKTQLSKLVERAARGEEIVIAKNGTPVARLVAMPKAVTRKRRLGQLAGRISTTPDFDAPLDELFFPAGPPGPAGSR